MWALNLLCGGVAAALKTASRPSDSVALGRLLIRDNSSDPESSTVAVRNCPISVIEPQPQPFAGLGELRSNNMRVHCLILSAAWMATCFSVGSLHRTDGGPSGRGDRFQKQQGV